MLVQVKKEGILAWHRDSLGILVQRFLFVLLFFISLVLFNGCDDEEEGFQKCIWKSCVPLCITIVLIVFKVRYFCLLHDRFPILGGMSEEPEDLALVGLYALSHSASDSADCSTRKL